MWLIFLILSIAAIPFAVLLLFAANVLRASEKKEFSLFNSLFAGVFLSAFFMFMPTHLATSELSGIGYLRAVLLSVINSIQTFAAGCEFGDVAANMTQCPEQLTQYYQTWISFIYVAAPMFTIGIVLSLFKNISAYIKYLRAYFKDSYIFSELNDKSLALARDIKKNNNKAAVFFTDVFAANEEKLYELAEQAKRIGAVCFKKDILIIDFKKHSSDKSISFFTIGDNETENLDQALKLISSYRERDNTHIYVFSTKKDSELLLTAVDKGKIKVRRINEVQSLVNRILYDNGDILFKTAKETEEGVKIISAVVVGMGRHGKEMVKALSWYGQMDGYRIEINAFDRDKLAQARFVDLAPELMSPVYNGVDIDGEAQYKITIHSGLDVQTVNFTDEVKRIRNVTYIMVALGDDDLNINTAVNLRMHFERIGIHPVIQAIVYNSRQKRALEGIKNFRGQKYDIDFIGDLDSSYAADVIIDSELEEAALKIHLKWGKEEEFWNYEYNYRSSMASAIHMQARIECKIPGAAKKEKELTDEERNIIESLEHRRWNAYMRAEGYVFSGSKDKSSRNDLAKMHHDLVDFSSLSEMEKRKDSKVGTE